MSRLFHYLTGLPKSFRAHDIYGLRPSPHAINESNSDKYGCFALPNYVKISEWKVIELEQNDEGQIVKWVIRKVLDNERDIVLVIIPNQKVIKTVWINVRSDKHKTLDKSRYSVPVY